MFSPNSTSFDTAQKAEQVLDALLAELDDAKIAAELDAPIDEAMVHPGFLGGSVATYEEFLRFFGLFVQRINRKYDRARESATTRITLDEAVSLLRFYPGITSNGHDAAVVDAGLRARRTTDLVLLRFGEALKAIRRGERLRRLEAQYVRCIDWETRCAMVSILLERGRAWLPDEIVKCPPAQLAHDVFQLVQEFTA